VDGDPDPALRRDRGHRPARLIVDRCTLDLLILPIECSKILQIHVQQITGRAFFKAPLCDASLCLI